MDVILTTKCNLKCSECCYLFNKYKQGENLDADVVINNMEKIKPIIIRHQLLSIIGGETFLYPDLVKVVKYVATIPDIQCTIFTNGTIYPGYIKELCRAMQKGRFHVMIGGYGNPEVVEKLQTIFTKYNISHVVRPNDGLEWIHHGEFIDHQEEKTHFCDFRYLTLMKNRVYACGRFAQAVNLGLIDIEELTEDEYVDLDDEFLLEKLAIMTEESFYKFTSTCKYCLRGSDKGSGIAQGS